jgi:hypothetical protein
MVEFRCDRDIDESGTNRSRFRIGERLLQGSEHPRAFPPSPIENQTTIPGELEHSPQITRGPLFEYQNSLLERLVEVCTTLRDRG